MSTPEAPPALASDEAFQSEYADWYQITPQPIGGNADVDEITYKAGQAMWHKALAFAAQQAIGEAARGQKLGVTRIALRAFAQWLREAAGEPEQQ